MELTGSFCNIEIVLEKPVDCSECFLVKSFRYIRTEDFFQKIFSQRNRELIDQSSDAKLVIWEYSLL